MHKLHHLAPAHAVATLAEPSDHDIVDPIQLLEVAVHDLRNPISGILAASQYLLDDAVSVLDDHHVALLHSIDSSGRSMLRLIEDILEICNLQSGKMRLDFSTANLQPLINRAMLLSQPVAERKKVQIELEAGAKATIPPVEIDAGRIVHALESLLGSLVKLTRPGSTIEIAAGARLDRVIVGMRSDGFAVSALVLRSLFNPFRSRANRSGVDGGTALALATVKQIIGAHGGVVRVESGHGSALTVKLALPLPAREAIRKRVAGAL